MSDLHEHQPLLSLDLDPDTLAAMVYDIKAELGEDAWSVLCDAEIEGRVMAVLLECRCAGDTTANLAEAIALAKVEQKFNDCLRERSVYAFTPEDIISIVGHAVTVASDLKVKRLHKRFKTLKIERRKVARVISKTG